ncbi:MAG: formamidopyrimidine-DNA glycosylase [Gammaproteobacteria bacterium]|nr:formamidopyrimidine-DNA glycosylase [Gammaproteobacteria bacterium]
MPEYPDLTVYVEHIERRVKGDRLTGIRLTSPFLLRSVTPGVDEIAGREVIAVRRLAKQLVLALADSYFVVIHLMIAGRLRWHDAKPNAPPQAVPKRNGLAAFDFETGSLIFTEASKKRRASLKLVHGDAALGALNPGGLEVFEIDFEAFYTRLRETPHTVKRALTDQRVFAGIGNAYSDEILFRAHMSPFKQGRHMSEDEARGLFAACRDVLSEWTARLRVEAEGKFPGQGGSKVTAFHPEMAVHGKYRAPCPVCGAPVQRIVRPENETNYCATCQTGGRLLADRSLSRLLKDTYPRRIEELEG